MGITATVSPSGDAYVDGVLDGRRWVTALTYSLPALPSDYGVGYGDQNAITNNFAPLNAAQAAEVHYVIGTEIATFLGAPIAFLGNNGDGDIRFAASDAPMGSAYAYYPADDPTGGDIFVGRNYPSDIDPVAGTFGWQTFTHELGHALGLKHPHNAGDEPGFGAAMPLDRDGLEFTVMSYRSSPTEGYGYTNEEFGYPQSFMMYDIAALQYLYGANFSGRSGDTHYRWDPTTGQQSVDGAGQFVPGANRIFLTVWDGDGHDLYDFSNYSVGLEVDLAPGGWTTLDPAQLANLGLGHMARGSIANALQFENDPRSLIEDAYGGSGDDTIHGNIAANLLVGGDGNDTVSGEIGDDTLAGGSDSDTLYGDAGNDTLVGDSGGDTLYGGSEIDVLNGDQGNDLIYGGDGNDGLVGGAQGDDTVFGGNGNDSLRGDAGNDTLFGGNGNDVFFGGSGIDTIGDFATGSDKIDLGSYHVRFSDLAIGGGADATVVVADQTLVLTGVVPGAVSESDFIGLEPEGGTGGGDLLVGGAGNDSLYGLGGADALAGAGGDDTLYGGNGEDTLQGHEGDDTLYGGEDNDFLDGSSGNDVVRGEGGDELLAGGAQGDDTVYGDDGSDSLRGDDGNDTLFGGSENDTLSGGQGDDTLSGEAGADTFKADRDESGTDTLTDFEAGTDKIDLTGHGLHFSDLVLAGATDTTIVLSNQTLVLLGVAPGDLDVKDFIGLEPENVIFGTLDGELLVGGAFDDTIFGFEGDDTLGGVASDDVLYGNDGNDTLLGDPGEDELNGEADSDFLDGGPGNDTVYGGDSNDFVGGAQGNDTVYGDDGDDTVTGDTGDDTLYGGAGDDQFLYHSLIPGNGTDTIGDFGDGNDQVVLYGTNVHILSDTSAVLTDGTTIVSDNGHVWQIDDFSPISAVTIYGTPGADVLVGCDFGDLIYGDDGDDFLIGEGNNDTLYGDDGTDTAMFSGTFYDYIIDPTNGSSVLTVTGGPDGADELHDIERLQFIDGGFYDVPNHTFHAPNQTLDPSAQDPGALGELYVGTGIPAFGFAVARDVDNDIELGLQVIYRQGPVVTANGFDSDGTAHIDVASGTQSTGNGSQVNDPTHAAWNFQYSFNTGLNGSAATLGHYELHLLIDLDSTAAVNYGDLVFVASPGAPGGDPGDWLFAGGPLAGSTAIADDEGTEQVAQNSQNYGEFLSFVDGGAYAFGPGTFDIVLQAMNSTTLQLLAEQHIQVHVQDPFIFI